MALNSAPPPELRNASGTEGRLALLEWRMGQVENTLRDFAIATRWVAGSILIGVIVFVLTNVR